MTKGSITTKRRTRRGIAVAAAAGLAAAMAGTGQVASAAGGAATQCGPAHFTADIRKGPDRDLSLAGSLSLKLGSSGRVTGTLVHYGERVPVTGKGHGRSFGLALHLRSGRTMKGVGTASKPIRTCAGIPKAGTATGPRSGDHGVWGYALGG